ncbi:MAG: nicotinate phosphoribosyltransferase [Nitrospiria bacterium]
MAAGLEQVISYLETLRFNEEEIKWLSSTQRFNSRFIDYLSKFRFSGKVYALPEGTVFFENEPVLTVIAPLPEAQLVETRIINILHYQTLIASKAARTVLVAPGKLLVDFGLRRSHGAEAGLLGARAAYLAGFSGSSNVLSEFVFGIPSFGTMAHSFVLAHDDEENAFENFSRSQPQNVTILIDTYDTDKAAKKVVHLATRLQKSGIQIKAVRLDSGDLGDLSFRVRGILDQAGLTGIDIFASGNLDEEKIQDLINKGAPIGGFGVGTHLLTSNDFPYLDCAYKLEEYLGRPRRKLSPGKATWPGQKEIYRRYDHHGIMTGDLLTLKDDPHAQGESLLKLFMNDGKRVLGEIKLSDIRSFAVSQLSCLPPALKRLTPLTHYPVEISVTLKTLTRQLDNNRF